MPPLWGSIDVFRWLTQGLRPGLWISIALSGLIARMCVLFDLNVCAVEFGMACVVRYEWCMSLNFEWVYCSIWMVCVVEIGMGVLLNFNGYVVKIGMVCVVKFESVRGGVWLTCGRGGLSAVGTTLLQSPGCNEGKARNGTLGTQMQNKDWAPKERHYPRPTKCYR